MSNHLRNCPKHRKPLPCPYPHCAYAAKPARTPKEMPLKCSIPECETYIMGKPDFPFTCKKHRELVPKKKILVEDMFCTRHGHPFPCPTCEERDLSWMR